MKDNAIVAAEILVTVKTGLGKVVPEYAKEIVKTRKAPVAAHVRVIRETRDLLSQMRRTTREKIFAENTDARDWYIANTEEVEDSVI